MVEAAVLHRKGVKRKQKVGQRRRARLRRQGLLPPLGATDAATDTADDTETDATAKPWVLDVTGDAGVRRRQQAAAAAAKAEKSRLRSKAADDERTRQRKEEHEMQKQRMIAAAPWRAIPKKRPRPPSDSDDCGYSCW